MAESNEQPDEQPSEQPSDCFEWLPSECADERYPMQLLEGELCYGDEAPVEIPRGKIINKGWGAVGSCRIVGEPLKPVPDRLRIAWFSYTEDAFYAGELELPRSKLLAAFRRGFRAPEANEQVSWDKILVGMGLGGWVSVWLVGVGLVREVARGQVGRAEREWSEVLDNPDIERASFIRQTLRTRLSDAAWRSYNEHGVESAAMRWPRYTSDYRWELIAEGVQVPLHVYIRGFDGERSWYDFARQPPRGLNRAPKRLDITWRGRKSRLLSRVQFDEAELFSALGDLGAAATGGPAPRLHVEYLSGLRVKVMLEGVTQRRVLERARVELSKLGSTR